MLRNATSRVIAAHLALVALSAALVLGFVYWQAGGVIDAETRRVVEAEARGLADEYAQGGAPALVRAIDRRLAQPGRGDAVYLLTAPVGLRLAGNLADWPPTLAPGAGWTTLELYRLDGNRPTTISALSLRLPLGERLLVGRDVAARAAFDRTLFRALGWGLAAMAAVTVATGWLLSRLVLRRIDGVAEAARRIMAGALDERAPVRGTGDEFDRLSGVLNAMLDRIAALVGDLRMVTDSLAHDIRSPLGRLTRHLEAALAEPADEARRGHIERALGEAGTVLATSSALLEISRIEAGIGAEQFGPVDLAAVARDIAELYEAAAEEAGVRLSCTAEPATVRGHAQLLAQAAANLVDNALKHAAAGGAIAVAAGPGPDGAPVLTVADRGPGVPEAERARVLGRFVRLDPSRGGEGAGLGLALVAAVARLHGARLDLADNAPGLAVTLRFGR